MALMQCLHPEHQKRENSSNRDKRCQNKTDYRAEQESVSTEEICRLSDLRPARQQSQYLDCHSLLLLFGVQSLGAVDSDNRGSLVADVAELLSSTFSV